ncbi:tetratricopeptide repeat protein [Parapedobacter koreensis]|uniref:Uncharacterized protein n=1 Tax=Parapedobacter koreensis TaxID=332977 RepID=A0A1H7S2W5_9SPHI|nr:tetratricopeptide repeat protein [Parapedobacter koreensis]SEL66636.1 hypothetical protein SAMN05421740_10839 [Parapedobacter koreensis]
MKKTILLLAFALAMTHAQGMQQETDSLKNLLLTANEDTAKVDILLQFAPYWTGSKPDSALMMAQRALDLSRKLHYKKGEAKSLNYVGLAYSVIGNLPKALSHYLEALKLNEARNDLLEMAKNMGNIAQIYHLQGDGRQQVDYLLKTKHILETIDNKNVLIIALANLGGSYLGIEMLDSARIYTSQAFELAEQLQNTYVMTTCIANLGHINKEMGNLDIALAYYRKASAYYETQNEDDGFAQILLAKAEIFRDISQADSSLRDAKKAFTLAANGGFISEILTTSKFLVDHYKKTGRLDSALHYQDLYVTAKDSLFSQEKMKEIQALSFAEQQRQEELAEMKRLEEAARKKNIQMAGIAVFLPIFFLFTLYLSRTNVKPRTIEFLGLVILLLLFEFISTIIGPLVGYMEHLTTNSVAMNMLIHIGVALLLAPIRKPIDRWVKAKLLHKNYRTAPVASPLK